jgi:hypothetical protein
MINLNNKIQKNLLAKEQRHQQQICINKIIKNNNIYKRQIHLNKRRRNH